jgi:hypothetical protein
MHLMITWSTLALALILLNASLTFENVWPTPAIRWQNALSIELAIGVLLVALARPDGSSILVRRVLPIAWLLLVLGRYLDVTAPGIYGRDFNLYWDAPHLGNVLAMVIESTPLWLILLVITVAIAGIAVAYGLSRIAWRVVSDATVRRQTRPVLLLLAVSAIGVFTLQRWSDREQPAVVFAAPVTTEYVHQVRSVLAMVGTGAVAPTIGPSPAALNTAPNALGGSDVHLVFVESYGAITFDAPELAAALSSSRAELAAAIEDTKRHVVSAYVESPTFGGSSWLAHLSLMSGLRVADPYSYQSLMTQQRDTLSTTFKRAGYRVVALMPGMRQAWPEGAFYQYDTIYGRDRLEYAGPRFGWWSIPDQYSLAKLDALEGASRSRPPLFVVFPTSTTHAPFGPVAPYQPDWTKVLTSEPFDAADVERSLAHSPDLVNLRADYANAMSYEFTTLAGYVRRREGDPLVMILVGDHQPPAAVTGKEAPWTVPVHVIANASGIIERLQRHGFRPGLTPSRPSIGEMHELVPILLQAFATSDVRREVSSH